MRHAWRRGAQPAPVVIELPRRRPLRVARHNQSQSQAIISQFIAGSPIVRSDPGLSRSGQGPGGSPLVRSGYHQPCPPRSLFRGACGLPACLPACLPAVAGVVWRHRRLRSRCCCGRRAWALPTRSSPRPGALQDTAIRRDTSTAGTAWPHARRRASGGLHASPSWSAVRWRAAAAAAAGFPDFPKPKLPTPPPAPFPPPSPPSRRSPAAASRAGIRGRRSRAGICSDLVGREMPSAVSIEFPAQQERAHAHARARARPLALALELASQAWLDRRPRPHRRSWRESPAAVRPTTQRTPSRRPAEGPPESQTEPKPAAVHARPAAMGGSFDDVATQIKTETAAP